jgi:DNA invertase Pin-like site-specific DNA recombinase
MTTRAVIYARTSSDRPISADDQVNHLKIVAADHGWTISNVFVDRPRTLKKGRQRRPGEAPLIAAIRRGEVQKILMIGIDRVGQSLLELVAFLEACPIAGASLWLDDRNLDTDISNGLSLFDLATMLAQHLRQVRRDRILRGQNAARILNVRFGRPPLSVMKTEKAKKELIAGKGARQIARSVGISPASVCRIKTSMSAVAS